MGYEESGIKLYKTTDYDIFKPLLGNRDQKSEIKIIESVDAVGQVPTPIICNENMEVIDGQNRLAAYKRLSLPVYFMVIKGLTIDHCRRLNMGQSNWGIYDWIASYAAEGNENYQRLQSLINSYAKKLPLEGIYAMALPWKITENGVHTNGLKNENRLKFTDKAYEFAVKRISSALDIGYGSMCKRHKYTARVFWSCVAYIYVSKDISASLAYDKLEEYEAVIPPVNTVSEQLRFFDDVFNRGKRQKDKVFLQAGFLRGDGLAEIEEACNAK